MDVTVNDRPIPTGEGLTFEKVWATLQENARIQAEGYKEIREIQKETSRKMAKLNKQMGDLHNRFGEMAEHLVVPSIEKRFNELGFHFNHVAPGGYKVLDDTGKVLAQVDILLLNSGHIMAVEVKARVHIKDIECCAHAELAVLEQSL